MSKKTIENILLAGDSLCFDFINTVGSRKKSELKNFLTSYDDFLKWCNRTEILPEVNTTPLKKYAKQFPAKAESALKKIISIRETLHLLFSSIANGKEPDKNTTKQFNSYLSTSLAKLELIFEKNKYSLKLVNNENDLVGPAWFIIKSAYDILTNTDVNRIKECPSCGWVFLDKTKNNIRRWCNPHLCGSREKAKNYYHRKKIGEDSLSSNNS